MFSVTSVAEKFRRLKTASDIARGWGGRVACRVGLRWKKFFE